MSWTIAALLIVTVGFSCLIAYVFAPKNKAYFADMSQIPIESDTAQNNSNQQNKEN